MIHNAECTMCGVTANDLPWEKLGMADLDEASDLLFDWLDGKPYCQGCFNAEQEPAP